MTRCSSSTLAAITLTVLATGVHSFVELNPLQRSFTKNDVVQYVAASFEESAPAVDNDTPPPEDIFAATFPPPLTRLERLNRAVTFWSTAVPILASYYGTMAQIKLREDILGEKLTDEEMESVWDAKHEEGASKLAETISTLKGFYVKTAQIISTRGDLFPKQYTDALSGFTDNLDPMPTSLVKAVITQELLHAGEAFDDVFSEFDDEPLGAASVAQVHRAVITEKYGGPKEVAVKVQRPSIESKLMGDIANLKAIAKTLQGVEALPLDYYTVFSELEKQLAEEFDFVKEAAAMDRIYAALSRSYDGSAATELPLEIPLPIPGLVTRRVLVMDFLRGVPLSRAREEMARKGIDPDGPEAKILGRKLLKALSQAFGRTILETGFFQADPHPGNIFVLEDGNIGLIDFGQVKQISGRNRETLAKVMLALESRKSKLEAVDTSEVGDLALELGIELKEESGDAAPTAIAVWLFDGSVDELPGGYDTGELSPNSPVKEIKSFPQDLVLVGRSSVLIKGISSRLDIPWSLSREWAPIAEIVLNPKVRKEKEGRVRFGVVLSTFSKWGKGKASVAVKRLPAPLRTRVAALAVKVQDMRGKTKNKR